MIVAIIDTIAFGFKITLATTLVSLPPLMATIVATEAKNILDWTYVGIIAFIWPCHSLYKEIPNIIHQDWQGLKKIWQG